MLGSLYSFSAEIGVPSVDDILEFIGKGIGSILNVSA